MLNIFELFFFKAISTSVFDMLLKSGVCLIKNYFALMGIKIHKINIISTSIPMTLYKSKGD